MSLAHSTDYDRGEPCAWCGKTEDGGLDCTGQPPLAAPPQTNPEGTQR